MREAGDEEGAGPPQQHVDQEEGRIKAEKLGHHRQAARHLRRDTTAWGLRPLDRELTVHTGCPSMERAPGPLERPSGSGTWAMPGGLSWAPRQEVLRSHPTCRLSGSRMAGARAPLPGERSVAGPARGHPRPSMPAGGGAGSQAKPAQAGAWLAARPLTLGASPCSPPQPAPSSLCPAQPAPPPSISH